MIVVYHKNNKVVHIECQGNNISFENTSISKILFQLAEKHQEKWIIWCHVNEKENLNFDRFDIIFYHQKIMTSYNVLQNTFLPEAIGYVEETPFIKINKEVKYPTWQMSSIAGGIHASVLFALKDEVFPDNNFDYFLNSFAKLAMPKGLFCYSDPELLKKNSQTEQKIKKNDYTLFRFVKQHYKSSWVFLLFLDLFLYEKKVLVLPMLFSLFFSKRELKNDSLVKIQAQSVKKVIHTKTIDVLIPTIGRKQFLYDTLKDLSKQTLIPENVIIVEQNPEIASVSELNYIQNEYWPFKIKHIFTHQPGACNARNLALAEVKSEWIFMADDDIRLDADFLERSFSFIEKQGAEQVTFGCYAPDYAEKSKIKEILQWSGFGSGCSIVKSVNVKSIIYNTGFEFGYGEDSDFGMQLRNSGFDILFSPVPEIIHLKAPMGGFRTKPVLAWHKDIIQPKPSPTIMLYKMLNLSKEQVNGYKTVLFFKYYKFQGIKNPINYYKNFRKQWGKSVFWANQLNKK
ncbi:glycosyltransferase family 2 protein [Flavobacterium ginsengiterrae]|uniref:Glycosyltransferase family A protein n=1 Tax=Flavobacterium ginsengiterrae TaxID=871695 RepID=A0ABP7H6U4_9FLAO